MFQREPAYAKALGQEEACCVGGTVRRPRWLEQSEEGRAGRGGQGGGVCGNRSRMQGLLDHKEVCGQEWG